MIKPFLHWAGGKRQLLPEIKKYIPKKFGTYYEPFVGAGAVLFNLQPETAIINDLNEELINCYNIIKNNTEELVDCLNKFQDTKEIYYKIRNMDRNSEFNLTSNIFKAARTIYLNKTCFNGLYRVNSKGQFNVSYGFHNGEREIFYRPYNIEQETLIDISNYLNNNNITITCLDFEESLKQAIKEDFIYLDPPYDTVSTTANFTSYTKDRFTKEDQIRVRDCFIDLTNRDCKCILSNAGTDFIKNLYKDFQIIEVKANRCINSKPNKRGKTSEVLIIN